MVAACTDLTVLLEVKGVDHGITLGTLGPEVVWHVFSLVIAKSWSFEDTHGVQIVMS